MVPLFEFSKVVQGILVSMMYLACKRFGIFVPNGKRNFENSFFFFFTGNMNDQLSTEGKHMIQ